MKISGFIQGSLALIFLFFTGCGTYGIPGYGQAGGGTTTAAPPGPPAASAPNLAQQVQNLEARVAQLETRMREASGPKMVASPAPEHALPAPSTAVSPKNLPAGTADKNFSEGLRLYHGKKYSEARTQLFQYLKGQPKGPHAAEARYYLADSFYQEGKYKEAAVEFNKLAQQFPQSILTPAGLLRQALAYHNLKQNSAYQSTLKKLIKSYPGSQEAKEAQKWLKEGSKKETPSEITTGGEPPITS